MCYDHVSTFSLVAVVSCSAASALPFVPATQAALEANYVAPSLSSSPVDSSSVAVATAVAPSAMSVPVQQQQQQPMAAPLMAAR